MTYYNEHDPKAAAWLRELIRAGHIPPGDVDERDIQLIQPHELTRYTQQHFFAGIGGWALALRWARWADDRPVRTGSCPCQPFSAAGLGLGEADERHLWPCFRNLITFGEPTVTFGEQVASAAGRVWLARVRADLEGLGYGVGAADLCSAGVGSPNIRQRLYWLANPQGIGRRTRGKRAARHDSAEAQPSRFRDARRLAHPNGGQPRPGELQSGGQHGQQPQDGGAGNGMGHAQGVGRDARGDDQDATQRDSIEAGTGSASGGLGNPHHAGPQGRDERGDGPGEWTPWAASVVLPCTDGKSRRIEPGSFPLAHGVPGRVGLLRGYGNAINPFLAAEFIQACEEALKT